MESESVGSSSPIPHQRSPFREDLRTSQNTPDRVFHQKGVCFSCKQEGHWSRDCPKKTKSRSGPFDPASRESDGLDFPEKQCPCGRGPCVVLTSSTERNPGRKFYTCPVNPEKCGFFQWCDRASPAQQRIAPKPESPVQHCGVAEPSDPVCPCGAGWCIIQKMEVGDNVGRKYFTCPVKKVSERCKFFQWYDAGSTDQMQGVYKQASPNLQCGVTEPLPPYPMCSCSAGRGRLLTMENGNNAGRKYFACPIKKGHGACNFFQWHDNPAKLDEANSYSLGKTEYPSFSLLSEEPSVTQKLDFGSVTAEDDGKLEETLSDMSDVLASPSSSTIEHQVDGGGEELPPIERLSLHEGSPNVVAAKPVICFRCGKGHWTIECVGSPSYPCSKCGRIGHWKKDCIA